MREENLVPIDPKKFFCTNDRPRELNHSLYFPSTANSYAECIEYIKDWFLSKFQGEIFKSVYVDGKYIYNEQRSLSPNKLIKREKPALAIVPAIDWEFTNDQVDGYQFGRNLFDSRMFDEAFFKDKKNDIYLALCAELILVQFTFRMKVETRPQQMDLYKYIKVAHRIDSTSGEEVDIDFHIPYELMIQIALDTGFEVVDSGNNKYPRIMDIQAFLSYLNSYSQYPFVYKYRGVNGKNEFFIRIPSIYVHIRPTGLSADDGENEGHLRNNFGIEMNVDVRFPAPKMYAYYSDHEPTTKVVYGAFSQPNGIISAIYTFKGTPIPKVNSHGWELFLETTWEDDDTENIGKPLRIDFSELLDSGDVGAAIKECIHQGISPSIFCDFIIVNGGNPQKGTIDWANFVFTSNEPVLSLGSYIGIYVDMSYVNNYIACSRGANDNRIQHTKDPESIYKKKDADYDK